MVNKAYDSHPFIPEIVMCKIIFFRDFLALMRIGFSEDKELREMYDMGRQVVHSRE